MTNRFCARGTQGRAARAALAVAAILLMGLAAPAQAKCTISSTSVIFGMYNVFNTSPLDSTGTISFKCGKRDKNILITLGRGGSSSFSRVMRSGTAQMAYNLYRDATHTSIWGDGTSGTVVYENAKPGDQTVNLTVFGRVPAGQDVAVGTYSDSVVVTIEW